MNFVCLCVREIWHYRHQTGITARNAGVHKSSLGLSTLRTQGLVNEPYTNEMWKCCKIRALYICAEGFAL